MRGRPNPQRSMLVIMGPGNGFPRTIRCGGLRMWSCDPGMVVTRVRLYVRFSGPGLSAARATDEDVADSVRSERAFCEELEYNLLYR